MDIALSIAAFLFSITGIVGCIVPIIPGVALSYVGLLCASFCSYSEISSATLWIWLAVTVAVSVIDYFLPGYFARLVGGTRAGSIGATAGVNSEEGGDDVRSSCPLRPGLHACYNGRYNGMRHGDMERIPENRSQFGLESATRLHEGGVASNRGSATPR